MEIFEHIEKPYLNFTYTLTVHETNGEYLFSNKKEIDGYKHYSTGVILDVEAVRKLRDVLNKVLESK